MALISQWKLDEGTGNVLNDSVGSNHLLSLGGSNYEWESGYGAFARSFKVGGDGVYAPDQAVTLSAPVTISISFWFYKAGNETLGTFIRFNNSTFNIYQNTNVMYAMGLAGEFTLDKWCHVVWTAAALETRLYIDGVLVASNGFGCGGLPFTSLCLGSYGGAFAMKGTMQNLMIYNNTLSSTDVTALYNSQYSTLNDVPEGVPQNSLQFFWRMDDISTHFLRDSSKYRRYCSSSYEYEFVAGLKDNSHALRSPIGMGGRRISIYGESFLYSENVTIATICRNNSDYMVEGQFEWGVWAPLQPGASGWWLSFFRDEMVLGINIPNQNDVRHRFNHAAPITDWRLLVARFHLVNITGGTVCLFLNGQLQQTITVDSYTAPVANTPMTVVNGWNGDQQWVGFWDRALTNSEISTLYNAIDVAADVPVVSIDGIGQHIIPCYNNPNTRRMQ